MYARAEWIKAGACDMVRGGVGDVGGITPLMKIAHLAEAFGMHMEVHGDGVGNLHVLCAMGTPGPVLRARSAAPVRRLRRAAALAEQARRPDGRRGLRPRLARARPRARTSTGTTSATTS